MTTKGTIPISDVLTRGSDILKAHPGFKLVGREQELNDLSAVLMRMKKRNLIVTGRCGVGITSIVLGIQDSKKNLSTPVDIVGKRIFWLNVDKLFESGNNQIINDVFQKVRQTLSKTRDSIVVLEDADDFIKAANTNGCTNLINGMMGDLKSGKYQAILESKDESLGEILKCDGDIREFCTLYEVKEPNPENLRAIVATALPNLERHHGIRISSSAVDTAVTLTEKYKLAELRAQPDASLSLLDQALTDYCRQAHSLPQHIEQLIDSVKSIDAALAGNKTRDEYKALALDALQALKAETSAQLSAAQQASDARQKEIRALYTDISDGEDEIRKLEDEIERIRAAQVDKAQKVETSAPDAASAASAPDQGKFGAMASIMAGGNFDTPQIAEVKTRIKKLEDLVRASSDNYKKKTAEVYASLCISDAHVLKSFSSLSGIPVDKLNEDDRIRLRNLDEVLRQRVIGQEEPTSEVARAVKRARVGLKMPNKPSGTFMFLGPSGVGKTELAKVLAEALGVPLLRFDMSEYMEKHAVAKLIGAPPGYEGYEHGGILTNAVRRNPHSVVLFDEIEKAHPDVFNLMLQLLDDARLTDSRGLTGSFKDCIIIMTTNIGTTHFLDEELPFSEAKELALTELRQQYRPEFLGRFGGNI